MSLPSHFSKIASLWSSYKSIQKLLSRNLLASLSRAVASADEADAIILARIIVVIGARYIAVNVARIIVAN